MVVNYAIAPDEPTFQSWLASFGGHIDAASIIYLDSTGDTPTLANVATPASMVAIVNGPQLTGGQLSLANQAWTMALANQCQIIAGLAPGW